MTARIIDGRAHAAALKTQLKQEIQSLGIKPSLAVVLIGDDAASQIYVSHKKKACLNVGIESRVIKLEKDTNMANAIKAIEELNNDTNVHGILLQLPVPQHLNTSVLINTISPNKDVDGLTPINLGRVMSGQDGFVPCTPHGVLKLLKSEYDDDLSGKRVVIIGRSLLFGKPMGQLLLNHNCTVTQCHSKTENIKDHTQQADILICATGQAEMIKKDWIKQGAAIIDVGITRMDNGLLTGDVDFHDVQKVASAITPVPGGVGPMTIACLLENTVKARLLAE